jgi:DNA-binding winged helix-turn-helix (wHTH) protein
MARVWPNVFVESSNLAVHIAALRRLLGDGLNDNRCSWQTRLDG